MAIIEEEAQIVREIFARYLDGDSPPQIATGLNERGIVTAQGCRWRPESVHAVISSRHVTGIRVFRKQDFGDGDWPVIIDGAPGPKPRTAAPTGPPRTGDGRSDFTRCEGW
jgi:hypothetical protein